MRDLASGELGLPLHLPHPIEDLACAPVGDLLALTTYEPTDRSLWIADLETGELRSLQGNNKPFVVTFTPDGSRIVTGNRDDGTVTLWDPVRGPTLNLGGLESTVQWVVVSPDGGRIAAVDSAGVHRI